MRGARINYLRLQQARKQPAKGKQMIREAIDWTKREHAAHVSTRYFLGGWEFETAQGARQYVNDQFTKYPARDLANTPFGFTVASGGVEVRAFIATTAAHVSTRTYSCGETMRDRMVTRGPTDCDWIVPGSAW